MKTVLGAALGNCVHVGGLHHFLKLAEAEGFRTVSLGPAVPVERLSAAIDAERPDLVAVSYRLTPEVAATLFADLAAERARKGWRNVRFVFGGTPPAAGAARASGLFDACFDGTEPLAQVVAWLRGADPVGGGSDGGRSDDLAGRIARKYPYPLLRHHFGRPSLAETIAGVRTIAEAGVVDVISLGTDQNAQEHFFRPDEMDPALDGAGGVPVRSADDLRAIFESSRCGNFPLMRCYSGTRDLIRWAEMSVATIANAWAAIPLCWYSVMDGRSRVPLVEAIAEKQSAMRWYAERGMPVEVNESHQWSLRDAHDALAVAMAFLAAYNAKAAGVRRYVAQYMFNTPPGTSASMDVAKMLAKRALIAELEDDAFSAYREVRAGIAHFAPHPEVAQGQLAASAAVSLALEPHILHVVGFSEGDHAAYPAEIVHSCNIVHGVLRNVLFDAPDARRDPRVVARRDELLGEARVLLDALRTFGVDAAGDPWTDPRVLASAVEIGLLDAPHFRGNPHLCGKISTRPIDGAWYSIDPKTGDPVGERARIERVLRDAGRRAAIRAE